MSDPGASAAAIRTRQPGIIQALGIWHSETDLPMRLQMGATVQAMLQQMEPNASPDRFREIGSIARRLEQALYCTAKSMEAYMDMSTLHQRLRAAVMSMMVATDTMHRMRQAPPDALPRGGESDAHMQQAIAAGAPSTNERELA